eukprot:m.75530 g.75530  ORF g.75530 m.75530 type:complete len:646 (-) comp9003_c0_seq2:1431-3368(-)
MTGGGGWLSTLGHSMAKRCHSSWCVLYAFTTDIDPGILFSVFLALGATGLCEHLDLSVSGASLPTLLTLIAFPLTFSINEAYARRQRTLEALATFRSEMWALHAFHRRCRSALDALEPGSGATHMDNLLDEVSTLTESVRHYCVQERSVTRNTSLEEVYESFRRIRTQSVELCELMQASKNSVNEVIVFQAMSNALDAFERIRVARDYPTPRSARQTYKVLGVVYPALMAPAYVADNDGSESPWAPYYVAIMVALVFGLLISVQDKLDNPFNAYECSDHNERPMKLVSKHPDNIDLSKLVFWPMLAISGEVEVNASFYARPACTLHGGPTQELKRILQSRSIGRHFTDPDVGHGHSHGTRSQQAMSVASTDSHLSKNPPLLMRRPSNASSHKALDLSIFTPQSPEQPPDTILDTAAGAADAIVVGTPLASPTHHRDNVFDDVDINSDPDTDIDDAAHDDDDDGDDARPANTSSPTTLAAVTQPPNTLNRTDVAPAMSPIRNANDTQPRSISASSSRFTVVPVARPLSDIPVEEDDTDEHETVAITLSTPEIKTVPNQLNGGGGGAPAPTSHRQNQNPNHGGGNVVEVVLNPISAPATPMVAGSDDDVNTTTMPMGGGGPYGHEDRPGPSFQHRSRVKFAPSVELF